MMNPLENNDPLDALLQEENRYVPDDGFTKRVMTSLPGRRRRRLPGFLLLGAALIGSVAAALWLPWEHLPSLKVSALIALNSEVLLPWLTVSLVIASLAWAVLVAVQWED
jgi:hypothetical protein